MSSTTPSEPADWTSRTSVTDRFDLVRSFLLASSIVVALGMTVTGFWVSERITRAAALNAAEVAGLYVDGLVAPLTPVLLDPQARGHAEAEQFLDRQLTRGLIQHELFAFKVWDRDGRLAYSSHGRDLSRPLVSEDAMAVIQTGEIRMDMLAPGEADSLDSRADRIPLLEIYSPIHARDSGAVIGVAEFYDDATGLRAEIQDARSETWLVVGLTTLAMLALMSGVAIRGGSVITRQRNILGQQVEALSDLLFQNRTLQERVNQANRRSIDLNERHMRRVSAEIHDGPVQLLAFASLRLDAAGRAEDSVDPALNEAVAQAIVELRQISRGLSLPELDGLSTVDVIEKAVRAHERRVGRPISVALSDTPATLSKAETICLFRFLQEGLNNAERHGLGSEVCIRIQALKGVLTVSISDKGPGAAPGRSDHDGLGLSGLKERIGGLGGELDIMTAPDQGFTLIMRLPVEEMT